MEDEMLIDIQKTYIDTVYRTFAARCAKQHVRLGLEAELPGEGRSGVFRQERMIHTKSYINGDMLWTGNFTISIRTQDADTASRLEMERIFSYLGDSMYLKLEGAEEGLPDWILVSAVSASVRSRQTADGAIWEKQYQYQINRYHHAAAQAVYI